MKKVLAFLAVFMLVLPMFTSAATVSYKEGDLKIEVKLLSHERRGNDLIIQAEERVLFEGEVTPWTPVGMLIHDYFLLSSAQESRSVAVREFGKVGAIPLTDKQTAASQPKPTPKEEPKKEEPTPAPVPKEEPKPAPAPKEAPKKEESKPVSTPKVEPVKEISKPTPVPKSEPQNQELEIEKEIDKRELKEKFKIEKFINLLPLEDRSHILSGKEYSVDISEKASINESELYEETIEEEGIQEENGLFLSVKNFFASVGGWFSGLFNL